MVELDLEYIRRQTLLLDLGIVLATVPALVWGYVRG
jgi:lipopolysaccharide/colanic/teichoic acid biosynthesis glycosyltransferase